MESTLLERGGENLILKSEKEDSIGIIELDANVHKQTHISIKKRKSGKSV